MCRSIINNYELLKSIFEKQNEWFYGIRSKIFRQIQLYKYKNIVDLGSGSGIISHQLHTRSNQNIFAIEKDQKWFSQSKQNYKEIKKIAALAQNIPLKSRSIDVVFTQMFFMWNKERISIFAEIFRILKNDGYLIICAEPDWGGRIDHPETINMNSIYINLFIQQQADPYVARNLPHELTITGFNFEGGSHPVYFDSQNYEDHFCEKSFRDSMIDSNNNKLNEISKNEADLIKTKNRFIYVPYFYFIAKKM